jgi:hypothetical protein
MSPMQTSTTAPHADAADDNDNIDDNDGDGA